MSVLAEGDPIAESALTAATRQSSKSEPHIYRIERRILEYFLSRYENEVRIRWFLYIKASF